MEKPTQQLFNINIESATECNLLCKLILDYLPSEKCKLERVDTEGSKVTGDSDNSFRIKYPPGSFLNYRDTNYELTYAYFFYPSRHSIDGERFDLEVNLYHGVWNEPNHKAGMVVHSHYHEDVEGLGGGAAINPSHKHFHYHLNTDDEEGSPHIGGTEQDRNIITCILFNQGPHKGTRSNIFFNQFAHTKDFNDLTDEADINTHSGWNIDQLYPDRRSFFMYEETFNLERNKHNMIMLFDNVQVIETSLLKKIINKLGGDNTKKQGFNLKDSQKIQDEPLNARNLLYRKNIEVITDAEYKQTKREQINNLLSLTRMANFKNVAKTTREYHDISDAIYKSALGGAQTGYTTNEQKAVNLSEAWDGYARGNFIDVTLESIISRLESFKTDPTEIKDFNELNTSLKELIGGVIFNYNDMTKLFKYREMLYKAYSIDDEKIPDAENINWYGDLFDVTSYTRNNIHNNIVTHFLMDVGVDIYKRGETENNRDEFVNLNANIKGNYEKRFYSLVGFYDPLYMHIFTGMTQQSLGNFPDASSKNLDNGFTNELTNDSPSDDKYRVYSQSQDDTIYRCKGTNGTETTWMEYNSTYINEISMTNYIFFKNDDDGDGKWLSDTRYTHIHESDARKFFPGKRENHYVNGLVRGVIKIMNDSDYHSSGTSDSSDSEGEGPLYEDLGRNWFGHNLFDFLHQDGKIEIQHVNKTQDEKPTSDENYTLIILGAIYLRYGIGENFYDNFFHACATPHNQGGFHSYFYYGNYTEFKDDEEKFKRYNFRNLIGLQNLLINKESEFYGMGSNKDYFQLKDGPDVTGQNLERTATFFPEPVNISRIKFDKFNNIRYEYLCKTIYKEYFLNEGRKPTAKYRSLQDLIFSRFPDGNNDYMYNTAVEESTNVTKFTKGAKYTPLIAHFERMTAFYRILFVITDWDEEFTSTLDLVMDDGVRVPRLYDLLSEEGKNNTKLRLFQDIWFYEKHSKAKWNFLEPNMPDKLGSKFCKFLFKGLAPQMNRTIDNEECQPWFSHQMHQEGSLWKFWEKPLKLVDDNNSGFKWNNVSEFSSSEEQGKGGEFELSRPFKQSVIDGLIRYDKDGMKWVTHNFCRNPGGTGAAPWCYTKNPNKRWNYCSEPSYTKSLSKFLLAFIIIVLIIMSYYTVKILFKEEIPMKIVASMTGATFSSKAITEAAKSVPTK